MRSALFLLAVTAAIPLQAAGFELKKGDHVCLIGNSLPERMQHFGGLETLIHARYPHHELVFRNLGYSGDEVNGYRELYSRMRSMDFGSQDQWLAGDAPIPQPAKLNKDAPVSPNRFRLTNTRADVVFAFYGSNEAHAGEAGLKKFRDDLRRFIKHTLAQRYNGHSPPRLVLFSPIAHEDLHDSNLPDGQQHNRKLDLYSRTMAEVAKAEGVFFVDLFNSTKRLALDGSHTSGSRLTLNGIHLTEAGDAAVADIAYQGLFGERPAFDAKAIAKLRAAVNDKNWYWFNRYRTTDGYSSYGDRAFLRFVGGQTNYEVVQRELETIDVLTTNRDKVVWAAAQGRDAKPDDSNLPASIPVISNKPGPLPGGKHLFLSGEAEIGQLTVHHGMKVNLFASEEQFPELVNPVQMAFDTRGRLWVAAWHTYPHWKPSEPMDDKLLILEDTDGDGRADKCTAFAADLHNPTGFEFWNGGVIVAQGPDILFLKDTNGDDRYDEKRRILHGMDTADTHHTANSFALDPGGALYWQEGTFHHTQVETPWGPPVRCANAGVYRYEPRTGKFDVYVTYGFANPHGHVFDRWGQDIVIDGTGAVPYHAPLFSSRLAFPQKHGQPPTVYRQRTRPCSGVEILGSQHFPDELQGNLLVANVIGFQGILQYKLLDKGSSFGATEVEPILSSSDANFRPADIEMGPDGAIYFTDWHNPIIGHMQHNLRDPNRDRIHGRVYRVTYPARPLEKPVSIADRPIDELLKLLEHRDDRVRARVRIELSGRDTQSVIAATSRWVQRLLTANDPGRVHDLLEALWVYQSHNVVNLPLLETLLRAPDERARAAAVRVCAAWRDRLPHVLDLLRTAAVDSSPRVRLMAVWAASYVPRAEAAEVVLQAQEQSTDEYLSFLSREAMRTLSPLVDRAEAEHRPIAFKSAVGQRYLLKNLSTEELFKRKRDRTVLLEIINRPGLVEGARSGAITALAALEHKPESRVLVDTIFAFDRHPQQMDAGVALDLLRLLGAATSRETASGSTAFNTIIKGANQPVLRQMAFATLVNRDGLTESTWSLAQSNARSLCDFLDSVPFLSDVSVRVAQYDRIDALLDRLPPSLKSPRTGTEDAMPEVRRAAMRALTHIRGKETQTFHRLAAFVRNDVDRLAAVRALQTISRVNWPKDEAAPLLKVLMAEIRRMRPNRRTRPEALDTLEFCDALSTLLPASEAKVTRQRLRQLGVRVVKVGTVFERMSYDKEVLAVQAGKPVEFVLENHDLMPHNFVVIQPGSLERVGLYSEAHAQQPGFAARQFVPQLPQVLLSSTLLQARDRQKLSFTAPTAPGVYPYVCTYPGHWRRMFGALYVVDDLDAYLADPQAYLAKTKVAPRDPLLMDHRPRTEWAFADLARPVQEMAGSGGRNFRSGKQVFTIANCVACHRVDGQGNNFGPDLAKLDPKWKPADILNEILTPSGKINEKFQTNVFELESGKLVTGLVIGESADAIQIVENPLAKAEPTSIRRADIVSRQRSTTSMMPKGLLDKLTRDEVLDLVAYVAAGGKVQHELFRPDEHHDHAHMQAIGH